MNKVELFAVSPDKNCKIKDESCPKTVTVTTLFDNEEKLTIVYNRFLAEVRKSSLKPDFVILMHHDVELDMKLLIDDLYRCKDKYDVIGLCGTEVFNVSLSPLNWYTGSQLNPDKRWGCVTHGELGNAKSFFSYDRKDVKDHEVACIDGLCIVFGPRAIDSVLTFDELFKFDQYDTDISLQTILTLKLKLGVIVEESLKHYSVGKSILTPLFLESEKLLRQKWNF